MPAAPSYWTREMVLALPEDGNRYELVHGELLVTPSPRLRHQEVLGTLFRRLADYVERHELGKVLLSPADISWAPDILVQPDLFVIAPEQAAAREWPEVTRLSLVVEILSPSTARQDRFTKRLLYREFGVGTYWIVDAEAGQAEVSTPGDVFPTVERERLTWRPPGVAEPLVIELDEVLR